MDDGILLSPIITLVQVATFVNLDSTAGSCFPWAIVGAIMSLVEDHLAMASLNVAKQQLRSAMKQKLGAISPESVASQSTLLLLQRRIWIMDR